MNSVLIVDDSAHMRAMIKMPLKKGGYNVVGEAQNGKEAIEMATRLRPDVIMLDNILPDMFGVEILKTIKRAGINSKVIMVSSIKKESVITKLKAIGAAAYVIKPFSAQEIVDAVNLVISTSLKIA